MSQNLNITECTQCQTTGTTKTTSTLPAATTTTSTTTSNVPLVSTTGVTEKIQPQPYPLQGQALPTGWGQYPQGAYYPPPVQKPQEIREEFVSKPVTTTTTTTQYVEVAPASTVISAPYSTTTVPITEVYTTAPLA